jgi:hypothetical protein
LDEIHFGTFITKKWHFEIQFKRDGAAKEILFTICLNSIIDFAIVKVTQRLVPDFDAVWQVIISATKKFVQNL